MDTLALNLLILYLGKSGRHSQPIAGFEKKRQTDSELFSEIKYKHE